MSCHAWAQVAPLHDMMWCGLGLVLPLALTDGGIIGTDFGDSFIE